MKAIALVPGTKDVKLIDWPEPKIEGATDVKARVLQVGICGTDREEASGGRADAPKGEKELIIGHEMLAEVVEVGAQVKSLKPKDLVVIMVRRGCEECDPCKRGHPDMCKTGLYTERGIKERHGYHSEYVVDEEKYCIKVPKELRNIAVLTEPTTVVEKAIDYACRLQVARLPVDPDPKKWLEGRLVLVAGLGPIGLLAAMVLRLRGARVLGLDIVDSHSARPKLLEAMGGKYVLGKDEAIQNARKTFGQIDMVIEAAGIPRLDFELIDVLGLSGVYVLTGVPGDDRPLNIDGGKIMRQLVLRNQIIFGSVNAGFEHFKQAVVDLEAAEAKWKGVVEKFITARIPYQKFDEVLFKKAPEEIKAVIKWHD
ncbi:MAG: glucose 1-dehydrogenase [Verrucomicrobiota bacterium]|nr:glucose 1-dehydrogenase [Verrucomicrobiota bacterium]